MSNLTLKQAGKEQLPRMKRLYHAAFPRAEKKPFFVIRHQEKQGNMELLALEDGDFVGLCITMVFGDLVLLDYFAIDEALRGKGYGGEALTLLRERYAGKKLFLEIERTGKNAPNEDERLRRRAFYLRNGLQECGVFTRLFGVEMELLCFDKKVSFEEYWGLYSGVFGKLIARRNVRQVKE